MTLTIDLTPAEEARLNALAARLALPHGEAARRFLAEHLPPVPAPVTGHEQERQLLAERSALLDCADAGTITDAQIARLRQVEADLDRLEDQDPAEQEADRRLAQTGDKLDEILALLRSLPRRDGLKDAP